MSAANTARTRTGAIPSLIMVVVVAFATLVATAGPAAAACIGGVFAQDHTDPDNYTVEMGKTLTVASPGLLVGAEPAGMVRVYTPYSETTAFESNAKITYTNSSGAFKYEPDLSGEYTGGDEFEYAVVEKAAHCSIDDSDVAYGIAEVVVKPIVKPDTYNMVGGKLLVPAVTGVLANDKGVDPDLVTIDWTTGVGDIDDSVGNGGFEYTAPPGFSGVDTFDYEVYDLSLDYTYIGQLSINVAGCAPLVVKPQAYNVNAGQTLTAPATGAPTLFSGGSGTNRRIQGPTDPTPSDTTSAYGNAAITYGTGGAFTYKPGLTPFSGTDEFSYSVIDQCGNEASETATVNVKPVINADTFNIVGGTSTSGNVLANDLGVDAATVDIDTTSVNGATIAPGTGGNFTYNRKSGFDGVDTFKYRVKDLSGELTYTGTATVNVANSATPPGPPSFVAATPGNAKATVRWGAPANTGGNTIEYVVTRGSTTRILPSTATQTTFEPLANGTTYTFSVRTRSGAGSSSALSDTATPRTVPGKPSNVRASLSGSNITVSWNGPSNGGASIQRSKVTASNGRVVYVAGSGRSARFTGMKPGSYTFTVKSENVAGWGPSSSRSSSVIVAQSSPTYTARYTEAEYQYLVKTARHFGLSVNEVAKTGVAVIRFILAIAPHPPTRAAARPQNTGSRSTTATYSVTTNASTMVPVSRYLVLNGNDTLKVGAALMQYFAALQGVR